MRKPIKINLDELVEAGILREATADKIEQFNLEKEATAPNRLLLAFGILGAVLVGLGIILIVAHNWDQFPRFIKNFLAFLPMLIGQAACAYTLWKKPNSVVWRESASVFLVFAIGACIATISQIYNIQGDLGSFLLTWLLLGLPLIYIMKSSAVSLLYIGGVIWFTMISGYDRAYGPWICWGLLAAVLPYYYHLWKTQAASNFFHFHSWALAIAGMFLLPTWVQEEATWLAIAAMSGLAIYYFIGNGFLSKQRLRHNPFLLIGTIGTVGAFLILSFKDSWENFFPNDWSLETAVQERSLWVAILLTSMAIVLLIRYFKSHQKWSPVALGFLVYILLFFIAIKQPIIAVVLSNIIVLAMGLFYINRGSNENSLGMLNLGLVTISILIIARFLDIDLSFIARGILFIIMGIGFFYANYRLVQKSKR